MITNLKESFGDRYKVTDDGTDDPCKKERCWGMEISGKYGVIYPYGYNGDLAVWSGSGRMISKLEAVPGLSRIQGIQGGEEQTFRFSPALVPTIAVIIRARKRRKLNPEQRARLAAYGFKSGDGKGCPDHVTHTVERTRTA